MRRGIVICVFVLLVVGVVWAATMTLHFTGGPGTGEEISMRIIDQQGLIWDARWLKICQEYQVQVPDEGSFFIYAQNWRFTEERVIYPMASGWPTQCSWTRR